MQLDKNTTPATTIYHGRGDFSVTHGKYLRIETTPGGEDILNERVPNGKKWTVTINIDVVEIDR